MISELAQGAFVLTLEEVAVTGTLPLLGALLVLMPWMAANTATASKARSLCWKVGSLLLMHVNPSHHQHTCFQTSTIYRKRLKEIPACLRIYRQHAMQSWGM